MLELQKCYVLHENNHPNLYQIQERDCTVVMKAVIISYFTFSEPARIGTEVPIQKLLRFCAI